MNKPRIVAGAAKTAETPTGSAWVRFWFAPADPIGLHVLRMLAGLLFLWWLLPFAGQLDAFFGLNGWFDLQAYREASRLPGGPPQPLGWSVLYLCGTNATLLTVAYWLSVAVLALFTLGVATRVTAVLTWIIVLSFIINPAADYDADYLLVVLAFYLMLGYVLLGQGTRGTTWLTRLLGSRSTWLFGSRGERQASPAANLAVRLLQVHFALVLVSSGLHKLQQGDWWSGAAFWYPLHPPFKTTVAQARQHTSDATFYLSMLSLGAYLTLAWQLGFPLFAWRPRWRVVLLGGALAGWLGTAFLYELPLFGPVLMIAALSYLTPAEWQALLGRVPGLHQLAAATPVERAAKRDEAASLVATRSR